eukprot:TRINITY_DN96208_c0_g1_i1.p1 TRINITY_DN96208_c0_g1~~TRINITY_DN96208_c0_g1_i1.p1  ORF type:complete len:434 (+),score=121.41 TRINITY_DN96208_c0_g1_i1:89-1390(+)
MIGAIIFLNSRGDIVLSRAFRDNVNIRALGEAFRTQIIATKLVDRTPVKTLGSVSFLHMRHENLYIVATSRANVNAALVFTFLSRMLDIFRAYFSTVTEETIKDNFVLVQELIDEVMDFGYPQNMEVDVLKMYITSQGLNPELLNKPKETGQITIKATGNIPWRREGIKYRKNEVFIDVVEEVNLLMSQQGNILNRDVVGQVVMKSFLSGMPECKFGLNDKAMLDKEKQHTGKRGAEIDLDDVTFHQCVKLGKFETDRTITFTPPDGEFVLMKYRSQENVNPPFRIISPVVREVGKTRVEIDFKVKAEFSSRLFGTNVAIKVPTPSSTASCKINVSTGKARYEAEHRAIIWRIRRFPGGSEFRFGAEVTLLSSTSENQKAWSRPPIAMSFQVAMLAASGLHVRFLKVHEMKLNYQAVKWVRYITKAGQYECRI